VSGAACTHGKEGEREARVETGVVPISEEKEKRFHFKGNRGLSNDVKVDQSVNDGRGHYVFKVGLPTHGVIVAPEGDAPNVRIITS
jgi:hypothetical protein